MTPILFSLSTWLHALATAVFIGHSLLLTAIYLPAFAAYKPETAGPMLSTISKRSRPWMYAALILFAITGVYLTLIDPNYRGLGNFGNPWAVLMLIKHLLILAMIALGFFYNAILRVGPLMSSNSPAPAIARFTTYAKWMAVCGVLVLLLTAFAQFE